jgi:alpha-tubulin suppressor-like RCC1 family protein
MRSIQTHFSQVLNFRNANGFASGFRIIPMLAKVLLLTFGISLLQIGIAGAAPNLITPNLPVAFVGTPYVASLMVGSAASVTSVRISQLPAGLTASHTGGGSISIEGIPTMIGRFNIMIDASDANAGALNASVNLTVRAAGVSNAVSVAAGAQHSCALINGGVQCWGSNSDGQLGDATIDGSGFTAQTIAPGSGVTMITAKRLHSCAVIQGGMQCWGNNGNGQLGNSSTVSSRTPVQTIAKNSGVTAIGLGDRHACAVKSGGLLCWGANDSGQLGTENTIPSLLPVQVIAPNSGVTAVAGGSSHTCAIMNGGVKCWGYNNTGQVANNNNFSNLSPQQTIAANSGATAIAAGDLHSCAVINGGIQCWGYNDYGQLGNGSSNFQSRIPVDALIAGGGATAVTAGRNNTCAIIYGEASCWGENVVGQLGEGGTTKRLVPTKVIPSGIGVTALSGGTNHTCMVRSGKVLCWGNGIEYKLGNDTATNSARPVQTITANSGVTALTGTERYSCAVILGGAQCWGADTDAPFLGFDSRGYSLTPRTVFGPNSGVTAIATGQNHRCVVIASGVQCVGANSSGQLGIGSTSYQLLRPVQTTPPNSGVVAVAAGLAHSCALKNGGVWCWGANNNGQLGNGNTTNSSLPIQTIADASGVTALVIGSEHSCVVKDGGVQCWGANSNGQLGNGATANSSIPVQTIPAGSGVVALAAGQSHTCALISGGVQCWGLNERGQLGNGETIQSTRPVQAIGQNSGVSAIAVGTSHSCAVIYTGVVCWGANDSGQLGDGAFVQSAFPVQAIAIGSGVLSIAAGLVHTCATLSGGVTCWGENSSGQLGTPFFANIPRAVPAATLAFGFNEQRDVAINTTVVSNPITVAGLGAPSAISITGLGSGLGNGFAITSSFDYSIGCTNTYTTVASTVKNGDTVCLRLVSASNNGETVGVTLTIGTAAETFTATTIDPSPNKRYRFNIPETQGHLYTSDGNEALTLYKLPNNIVYEGVDHKIYSQPVRKNNILTVPYYRVYFKSERQHFWTRDIEEYKKLIANTTLYADEGIAGYIFPTAGVTGSVPLYRLTLKGTSINHWTTDTNEFTTLSASGSWTPEGQLGNHLGIVGYVIPN